MLRSHHQHSSAGVSTGSFKLLFCNAFAGSSVLLAAVVLCFSWHYFPDYCWALLHASILPPLLLLLLLLPVISATTS
jgi:hypothetical protein